MTSDGGENWSQSTRDWWFFAALALSTASIAYLFSPYLYVLLFSSVTVVVTWPIYRRVLERSGGRAVVAAPITFVLLCLAVFGPLGTLLYVFVREAVEVVGSGVEWVQSGELEALAWRLQDNNPEAVALVEQYLPEDLVQTAIGWVQDIVLLVLNAAGSLAPRFVAVTVNFSIDALIFVFSVVTLYIQGPRVLQVVKHLSPMDDDYEDRLFRTFGEFANNMVLGSLLTAGVQGAVAALGYSIAGVESVVFFGILTAILSFVPVVGTALVWLPLAAVVWAQFGWHWGLFLAVWSVTLTATVDNVVKPAVLRGKNDMHPLLVFLAVFGGLAWMGVPGVLVGPVLVAFFLALYTIYLQDYLGIDAAAEAADRGTPLLTRLWQRVQLSRHEPDEKPPSTTEG